MIITVYNLPDFERLTNFLPDIYYSWETQNAAKEAGHFPVVDFYARIFGWGKTLSDLVVYSSETRLRMTELLMLKAGSGDPHQIMVAAINDEIAKFEGEVSALAKKYGCRAIPGELSVSYPDIDPARIDNLTTRTFELERRLNAYEHNDAEICDRVEERLSKLEARLACPGGYD